MRDGFGANSQLICAFTLILIATLTLAALPFIICETEPTARLTFKTAQISINGKPASKIHLPYSWPTGLSEATYADYVIDFTLDNVPSPPQRLFIPTVRQHLIIKLNGTELDRQNTTLWANLSRGYIKFFDIPPGILIRGQNRMVLSQTRNNGIVPGYLSRIYIGDRNTIVANPWLVKLLGEQSRTITVALHLFIVAGLLTAWGARLGDAIFRWLAIIGTTSLMVVIAEFRPLPAIIDIIRPWLVMILSSFGLMMVGLAMAISEMPRPRWLIWLIIGIPTTLILFYATELLPLPATILPSLIFAIGGHIVAGIILLGTFARQREWVYGLLAVPFFLTAWFGMRDVAVAFNLIPGGFLLSTFVRPVTYLSVLVLLMYKLASSLNRLDQANDVLRTRLAAQEAELSALHAKEKFLVGQTVRGQERQRLMYDLHDGLSGYLVSIIAMSEKHEHDVDIERTAREALEDLRLVVHSLDLGDTDLPLALAGFRERLTPRLRRLGVKLTWSMEKLPEIQSVTPGNALSVLRILQEAVTNALKHGQARTIHIEGAPNTNDTALISVTNDTVLASITNDGDLAISSGTGNGLSNMQRRAQKLGGYISTTKSADGYELQLCLPRHLLES